MTELSIRECANGWTVVRVRPELLGTFTRRDHAQLFLDALRGGGQFRSKRREIS